MKHSLNPVDMHSRKLIEKFIYSCSHDLRAPVSSIQGLVRIAGYYPQHDEIHKCLEMIDDCTNKMDKLISSLQEYMVNNQQPLVIESLDPNELIDEVRVQFKNQLDACSIELHSDIKPFANWKIDKYSILRILKHLVANSISFFDPAKRKGKITIRVDSTKDGSTLEVSDNGKGISQDQQERIFDIFSRATEASIGLGMGLFLAKSLVDKMGALIRCTSTSGEGTTIQISFPKLLRGELRLIPKIQKLLPTTVF